MCGRNVAAYEAPRPRLPGLDNKTKKRDIATWHTSMLPRRMPPKRVDQRLQGASCSPDTAAETSASMLSPMLRSRARQKKHTTHIPRHEVQQRTPRLLRPPCCYSRCWKTFRPVQHTNLACYHGSKQAIPIARHGLHTPTLPSIGQRAPHLQTHALAGLGASLR